MKYYLIIFLTFLLASCASNSSNISNIPEQDIQEELKTEKSKDSFGGVQFFMDGMMFFEQGDYARAILEFQDAIEAGSNSAEVFFNMSEAYWMLQKFDKSIFYANKAILLDNSALDLSLIHI